MLYETEDQRRRQRNAAAEIEQDMRVRVVPVQRRGGKHIPTWEFRRHGKIVAIAGYRFRFHVPDQKGWNWKIDVAKVKAIREMAEKHKAIPLFFIETYGTSGKDVVRGVNVTFNTITGTVLRDGYRESTMTLNVIRDEGDRNDPVYLLPDFEQQSLHLLANRLWPESVHWKPFEVDESRIDDTFRA